MSKSAILKSIEKIHIPTPEEIYASCLQPDVSIDDFLHGRPFYHNNLPTALRNALHYAGDSGVVATMPELITARVIAKQDHVLWKDWHTAHSEEDIGIDTQGRFYRKDEPVLVVVHGGGLLTPERIEQAYTDGLVVGSVGYTGKEFSDLLDGKLADGTLIDLYKLEEIQSGVSCLPHRFGVVMPYALAQKTKSGYYTKRKFLENPLVHARTAGCSPEQLGKYFDQAKDRDYELANTHSFGSRSPAIPHGRLLFLMDHGQGLYGYNYLANIGCFFGVGSGGAA